MSARPTIREDYGEETDRLAQVADDMLLLASAYAGELPLRRTPVPIAELLDSIATRFRRRAVDAGRTIEVAASSGLVALVDRRRLEQALANLVVNALRHGSGTVRLQAIEVPAAIVLHVSDEGQGFRHGSSTAPSNGSAVPTDPEPVPGSAWRSWPQSRTLSAAPPQHRINRTGAPTWR